MVYTTCMPAFKNILHINMIHSHLKCTQSKRYSQIYYNNFNLEFEKKNHNEISQSLVSCFDMIKRLY